MSSDTVQGFIGVPVIPSRRLGKTITKQLHQFVDGHEFGIPGATMEPDPSLNATTKKGASLSHSSGGKIPYVCSTSSIEIHNSQRIATLSMFGLQREDGMPSPRIGNRTLQ